MNGWISVDDRLPKNGATVLVWLETLEHAAIDDFAPALDCGDMPEFCAYGDSVTHWQPLPGPPSE